MNILNLFSATNVQVASDVPLDGSDILTQGLQNLHAIPGMAAAGSSQGMPVLPQELMLILQKAMEENKDKETVMLELKAMKEAMIKQTGMWVMGEGYGEVDGLWSGRGGCNGGLDLGKINKL